MAMEGPQGGCVESRVRCISCFMTPLGFRVPALKFSYRDLERAMHGSQIFGPCAIPFGLEKQTLLRVALQEVLRAEVNIYESLLKEVRAWPCLIKRGYQYDAVCLFDRTCEHEKKHGVEVTIGDGGGEECGGVEGEIGREKEEEEKSDLFTDVSLASGQEHCFCHG